MQTTNTSGPRARQDRDANLVVLGRETECLGSEELQMMFSYLLDAAAGLVEASAWQVAVEEARAFALRYEGNGAAAMLDGHRG